jgi:hypothetical protein
VGILPDSTTYVKCYDLVRDECGVRPAILYGFLEELARNQSESGKSCRATRKELAEAMMCSPRSIGTYLTILREHGWVTFEGQTTALAFHLSREPMP